MDHGDGNDDCLSSFRGGIYKLGCHLVDFFVSMLGEPSAARPPVLRDDPGLRDNGLCEHDLAVQRTILRMIAPPLPAAAGR